MLTRLCRHSAIVVSVNVMLACGIQHEDVRVDYRYSEYLTVAYQVYEAAARANAMSTVNVVQVYESGTTDGGELRQLRAGRLLYEARNPSEIEALFRSLQAKSSNGQCELGDGPAIVVVAYDRDLPRAGIVRLYECESSEGPVIGVRPVGDSALTYSADAVRHLKLIGVLK